MLGTRQQVEQIRSVDGDLVHDVPIGRCSASTDSTCHDPNAHGLESQNNLYSDNTSHSIVFTLRFLSTWRSRSTILITKHRRIHSVLITLQPSHQGFPFHFIHFVVVILEYIFLHQMVQFKFAWLHKLCHEIQPLYRLVHLEHHICKGTYPTSPAAGLWEVWIEGGTLFFCNTLACVPYFYFNANSVGPNLVVHNMWPHKSCIQWHTLHHVAHSDIYAVNVPSENDEKFSRDVKHYRERLQCSFFIRHPAMSDMAGFVMTFILGLAVHYVGGIGLFHVWSEGNLHFTG